MPIETCDLGKAHQLRLPGQCTGTHLSFHAGNKLAAAAVKPKDPPQPKDGKGMYIINLLSIYHACENKLAPCPRMSGST